MDNEIWKPIDGYEYYEVSNLGNVRSVSHQTKNPRRFREGRVLAQAKVSNGYMHVSLTQEGKKKKSALVHRLVAKAFVPNPDNKKTVNHKNGDKEDNRAENLEWCTHSENSKHAYTTLGYKPPKVHNRGKRSSRRFSDEQVRAIRADKRPRSEIAQEYGIHVMTVGEIKRHELFADVPDYGAGAEVHDFATNW